MIKGPLSGLIEVVLHAETVADIQKACNEKIYLIFFTILSLQLKICVSNFFFQIREALLARLAI